MDITEMKECVTWPKGNAHTCEYGTVHKTPKMFWRHAFPTASNQSML